MLGMIMIILGVIAGLAVSIAGMVFILFAIIPRSIKLLKIRIAETDKKIEEYECKKKATYKSNHGQWSPSGWAYDERSQQWQQPDYNQPQGNKTLDPRIKIERNGPTFEEWKAEKEKQNPRG